MPSLVPKGLLCFGLVAGQPRMTGTWGVSRRASFDVGLGLSFSPGFESTTLLLASLMVSGEIASEMRLPIVTAGNAM